MFGVSRRDGTIGNYVSQVMEPLWKELEFAGLALMFCFNELSNNSGKERKDVREVKGIHEQGVEILRDVFPDVHSENTIHNPLERRLSNPEAV